MTKYLSLVHANVIDISQLKKESEYRSVFTDAIELVDKNVCLDRSIVIRSYDLLKSESYDSIHG